MIMCKLCCNLRCPGRALLNFKRRRRCRCHDPAFRLEPGGHPGQNCGRGDGPKHPDLEVEFKHRVHAADVAFEHHDLDHCGQHETNGNERKYELVMRFRMRAHKEKDSQAAQHECHTDHRIEQKHDHEQDEE